jgi:hypothetical protein
MKRWVLIGQTTRYPRIIWMRTVIRIVADPAPALFVSTIESKQATNCMITCKIFSSLVFLETHHLKFYVIHASFLDKGIAEKRELSEKELAEVKATSATYQPKYMGKDPGTAMGEVMSAQGLFSYIGLLRFGPIGSFLKRLVYGMAAQSSVITLVAYGGMTNTKGYPMEIYGDSAPPADFVNLPVPSIAMELAMCK